MAGIATSEQEDTTYAQPNKRKSGIEGAKARNDKLDATRRSEIATKAAKKRWRNDEMAHMTFDERFQKAFDEGLSDIKFFVKRGESLTVEALRKDALAFQEAIVGGKVKLVDGVD